MIKYQLKIGKGILSFETADSKTAHKFGAVYGALPSVCDNCKSDDIYLSYKSPKGNDYYSIACKNCGAELTFHQKKEGGFYIVRGEKMQVYGQSNGADAVKEEFAGTEVPKEDMPF